VSTPLLLLLLAVLLLLLLLVLLLLLAVDEFALGFDADFMFRLLNDFKFSGLFVRVMEDFK
jgi:hypothetical protein